VTEGPVSLSIRDDVAHLVLDQPPKNELDWRFFEVLSELVDETLPALEVRGLVLSGRGRHFSSGSDVNELLEKAAAGDEAATVDVWEANARNVRALGALPYPTVAAVSGVCLGSGLELALACHYRVASTNAVIALPEAQLGLMPGCGGTVVMSRLIGPQRALDLILTGRLLDANEALELGVVDHVVPRKKLLDTAERLLVLPVVSLDGSDLPYDERWGGRSKVCESS